jgi:hypothetical protein
MYSRALLVALLAMPLAGCDLPFGKTQPYWALVNKSKIQSAISDSIKQSNPYPKELGEDYEAQQQEYERNNRQISELHQSGMMRCLRKNGGAPLKPQPQAYSVAPEYGAMLGSATQSNNEATEQRECLQGIEKDQLIVDLKAKAQLFIQLQKERREHDIKVQKITSETIDAAVEAYARANGFSLIVSNEPSIAYSETKQVLDVTDGVTERILHPSRAK